MNKKQTLELLQKQLPCLFTLDEVITIINGIEEDTTNKLNAETIRVLMKIINTSLEEASELVDYASAEFGLDYNYTVELNSVDVDVDKIMGIVEDAFINFNEEVAEDVGFIKQVAFINREVFPQNSDLVELKRH